MQLNCPMNSPLGSPTDFLYQTSNSGLGSGSGDMNWTLGSGANSGTSIGASSLVTDANSALSGGPHLQRSSSVNTESYMRLPTSPMSSFTSNNNISISGSSALDGSSIVQQSSLQDQIQYRQQQQGASCSTSQTTSRMGQVSTALPQLHASSGQELNGLLPMRKKARLDFGQEDILPQQVIQQMLQRQESSQLQRHNPQVQALIQQQRLLQQQNHQQQMLQSMPHLQHAQMQQQLQTRQSLPPRSMQMLSGMKRTHEGVGICARKLMQYLYHQRQRPVDNNILYWRKFVAEYFAPCAKKKWCFSLYENVGHNALGVFAQDVWHCDICGSKSGKGFEASFEVLPRLNKINFDSGVIDELLFIDMPTECRFPSGMMMLEYKKAIQESVYEHTRVVREGQLRIIFSSDLKIVSWEFCAQRHEEYLLRRLVAPQVNHLVQVAQKYQKAASESASAGLSPQNLQENCDMFVSTGRQLAKNLDLQFLNDLGFSKRYVRFLQISEVVNSMKDLMDFSREHKVGPIESLKKYPRQVASTERSQMTNLQEMEKLVKVQGPMTDENILNKDTSMQLPANNVVDMTIASRVLSNSAQPVVGLSSYQNLLRLNSMNSNTNTLQPDIPFNGLSHSQHLPFQGSPAPVQALQNGHVTGMSSFNHAKQELQQNQQSGSGENLKQQHAIEQFLHEMMNANGELQQTPNGQSAVSANDIFSAVNGARGLPTRLGRGLDGSGGNNVSLSDRSVGLMPSRNGFFNTTTNTAAAVGCNALSLREASQNRSHHLTELDIHSQFIENGSHNQGQGNMGYAWKS